MIDVTLEELASALIACFEGTGRRNAQGLFLAYEDTGGVWTIGRGHTSGVTAATPPATQAQVDAWFAQDQAPLFAIVTGAKVSGGILEEAALVSFGYNCGAGALQRVMAGQAMLTDFVHDAKKNVLDDLVRRRHLESVLMALGQQLTPRPLS